MHAYCGEKLRPVAHALQSEHWLPRGARIASARAKAAHACPSQAGISMLDARALHVLPSCDGLYACMPGASHCSGHLPSPPAPAPSHSQDALHANLTGLLNWTYKGCTEGEVFKASAGCVTCSSAAGRLQLPTCLVGWLVGHVSCAGDPLLCTGQLNPPRHRECRASHQHPVASCGLAVLCRRPAGEPAAAVQAADGAGAQAAHPHLHRWAGGAAERWGCFLWSHLRGSTLVG